MSSERKILFFIQAAHPIGLVPSLNAELQHAQPLPHASSSLHHARLLLNRYNFMLGSLFRDCVSCCAASSLQRVVVVVATFVD